MLLVKTKAKESPIHGLGLFADQFIPKGTDIWRFTPGFDQKFTREEILAFPEALQIYLYKYSWRSKKSKLYCFSSDDGKYFNHSENPNCLSEYRDNEEEVVTIAQRDIQQGEELTDNYSSFEFEKSEGDVLDEIAEKYHLVDELDPRFK
jgi:SET domain-containing protein